MIDDVKQHFNLSSEVAVVAEAGSGLGQGIAEGYSQKGAAGVA
jgi:NADP-dependent 3-hydroxy acid dehydrogenase YdfG